MQKAQEDRDKIVKFHRGFQLNIGFFLIAIIFLYIGFHIYSSLTKVDITVYNVEAGTIASNNAYQALAIRDETIIGAEHDGDIYYYGNNKSRVGVRSPIYALDSTGDLAERMKAQSTADIRLGGTQLATVSSEVDAFIKDYTPVKFHNVYAFKHNMLDMLEQLSSEQARAAFSEEIEAAQLAHTFETFYAPYPGLLCFTVDGFESINLESYDASSFDVSNLEYQNLRTQDSVATGDPVYKLINSEDWFLVVPVDKEMAEILSERENLEISFLSDGAKAWTGVRVEEKAGNYYLILSLDDSMERYADQRLVHIELLLESESGLKIPNSAITYKEFFVIPKEYFMSGADSNEQGLLIKGEEGQEDRFVLPTIYLETEDAYYIDAEKVSADDRIILQNSHQTYPVNTQTDTLPGVYSVNKGYTIFKQIEIIYQNDDYTVIRTGTNYGIALYDHIVLQADLVDENQIIY